MTRARHRVLLLFADGVGLAGAAGDNPFACCRTPQLERLLGGPLTRERCQRRQGLLLTELDACLGVEGLPQSATGQTTLFTGVNAQAVVGRHMPALPGPRLRALLAEHSLMKRLREAERQVTFANAFTTDYLERLRAGEARASVTTWAVLASEAPLRLLGELARGEAVTWDVTGEDFPRPAAARGGRGRWVEAEAGVGPPARVTPVSPAEAGRRLAALAAAHHLTLYETFLPDLAGHHRWGITAEIALGRLDGLLGGALGHRSPDVTVVLTSDHGNVEEAGHRRHTRNPVPLLAVGPLAGELAGITRLDEVTPRLSELLLL
ncbi:MAG TPA: metalloenzyme [Thermoanaerobaculia bacterium]|nr:metalloenzyme [Thermoanaerobaculia bacterium]